ncbi:hypothetical protein D9M68_733090 [compost metagenome]
MTHPEVHVALFGLRHGAQAAHQEQPVNRQWWITPASLVGEGARQALGFGEQFIVGFEATQPGRGQPGNIARQQRVVDVKQQRQQLQDQLLARRQCLHGAGQAPAVDLEKTRAQLRQHLAVDTVVDIRVDFLGAAHAKALRGDAPRLTARRGDVQGERSWQRA